MVESLEHPYPARPQRYFFFSSRRRNTICSRDWSSDVCSSDLPQLFNVLKGDMSLVGPRPVPPYEVAGYQARHHNRFAAPPGITGWWQVKGRCRVSFEEIGRASCRERV